MKHLLTILMSLSVGLSALCGAEINSSPCIISLDEAIEIAIDNSVSTKVAENQRLTSYWRFNSYKANMLPEISFTGTMPSYSQSYATYQREDGSYTFVKNNNLEFEGGLQMVQNIPLTGGQIALQSSLDFIRQIGDQTTDEYMSIPIELTLIQPIFGVNTLRWAKRIEPILYEESQRIFDEDMTEITLSVTAKYFNALLYMSKMEMARENLKNSEELYRIAKLDVE